MYIFLKKKNFHYNVLTHLSFFSWLSMIKQSLVWVDERSVLAHDVRVDKGDHAVASADPAV
jgi:hypothetical protein